MLRLVLVLSLIATRRRGAGPAAEPLHRHRRRGARDGLARRATRDPVPDYAVRLTYIDHAMFLIQTPGGLSAVTDYVGCLGTDAPVPGCRHDEPRPRDPLDRRARPADRACPARLGRRTDAGRPPPRSGRDAGAQRADRHPLGLFGDGVERFGNSIFVFEVGGALHRPSGPSAPRARCGAIRRARPARRGDGAGRRRADAGAADDDPGAEAAAVFGGDPDALVRVRLARRVPRGHGRRVRRRPHRRAEPRRRPALAARPADGDGARARLPETERRDAEPRHRRLASRNCAPRCPKRAFRDVAPAYLEEPRGRWKGQAGLVVAPAQRRGGGDGRALRRARPASGSCPTAAAPGW